MKQGGSPPHNSWASGVGCSMLNSESGSINQRLQFWSPKASSLQNENLYINVYNINQYQQCSVMIKELSDTSTIIQEYPPQGILQNWTNLCESLTTDPVTYLLCEYASSQTVLSPIVVRFFQFCIALRFLGFGDIGSSWSPICSDSFVKAPKVQGRPLLVHAIIFLGPHGGVDSVRPWAPLWKVGDINSYTLVI